MPTKNKDRKAAPVLTILALIVVAIIFIVVNPDGADPIKYWGFYYPVHKLFGEHLYLPYYLEVGKWLFIFIFLLVVFLCDKRQRRRKNKQTGITVASADSGKGERSGVLNYAILGVISVTVVSLAINDLTKDMTDVRKNEYHVEEVDLDQLKRRKRGRGINIVYTLGDADMDVYQYRILKEIKENFTLSVDNFDYYVKPAKVYRYYTPSPPLTEEDKRKILKIWNISSDKERKQLMEQMDLKVEIKLKVYSLPRSRKMLKYEFLEPVGTIEK